MSAKRITIRKIRDALRLHFEAVLSIRKINGIGQTVSRIRYVHCQNVPKYRYVYFRCALLWCGI